MTQFEEHDVTSDAEAAQNTPPALSRRTIIKGGASAATVLGIAGVLGTGDLTFAFQESTPATPGAGATPTSGTPAATTTCAVLTPELTEGPYYVDEALVRRDITDGKPGIPLTLRINVQDVAACAPLADAAVEIWHCDAHGYYSGVSVNNPGSDAGPDEAAAAAEQMFLRGVQITDASGNVESATIYPGWYVSRTVHIHMKVHVGGEIDAENTYENGHTAHTGQLFFDDAISDEVFATEAYAGRPAERTYNDEDNILGEHDDEPGFFVELTRVNESAIEDGFIGTVTIGVDPSATPTEAGAGGGGSGGPGGPGERPDRRENDDEDEDEDESASPSPAVEL